MNAFGGWTFKGVTKGKRSPVPTDLMYSQGEETPGCVHQQRSLKTLQRHYPQSMHRLVLNSLHNPVAQRACYPPAQLPQ